MEAVIQAFINSILGFNKEQLFGLCVVPRFKILSDRKAAAI